MRGKIGSKEDSIRHNFKQFHTCIVAHTVTNKLTQAHNHAPTNRNIHNLHINRDKQTHRHTLGSTYTVMYTKIINVAQSKKSFDQTI